MTQETTILDRFSFRIIAVLAASLYVSELGSIKNIFERLLTVEFYYEFGVTFLIAFTVTELVYRINKRLSKIYPLHNHTGMRIILQVICGLILPCILVFLMAALYFAVNNVNIFKTDYLVFVFPLVVVLLILLNLLFILVPYFVHAYRLQKEKEFAGRMPAVEPIPIDNLIKAYSGVSVLHIKGDEIQMAYIVGGKVVVNVPGRGELITDYTLDELENLLSETLFFRLNRQLIARKDTCNSYQPKEYGKLEVLVEPVPPVNTVVSQLKAKAFKEWVAIPVE